MNGGFKKAHRHIKSTNAIKKMSIKFLPLLKNNEKGRKQRAEPLDPKRTKGSFKCRVSIDRSTYPPSFIRRASLGFPGRCQLLLHTIEQAKRLCPLRGYKGCNTPAV